MKILQSKDTTIDICHHKYSLLYLSKTPLITSLARGNNQTCIHEGISRQNAKSKFATVDSATHKKLKLFEPPTHKSIRLPKLRNSTILKSTPSSVPHKGVATKNNISFVNSPDKCRSVFKSKMLAISTRNSNNLHKSKRDQIEVKQKQLEEQILNLETQIQKENLAKMLEKSKLTRKRRMALIMRMYHKSKSAKKSPFGKAVVTKFNDISYTRESLENLVDNNSMRYFDSYKKFIREYHQQIILGLLAPSSKLKFRMHALNIPIQ